MAELHINLLADKLNLGELEDTLANLPDEVDETYGQAMQRIEDYSGNRKKLAKTVLMWIACSAERLSARALQHILATKLGKLEEKYLTSLSTITAACAGLVVVQDDESRNEKTVRFVREYCLSCTKFANLF
jgi:ankyrin repeat domain-containing protein 50